MRLEREFTYRLDLTPRCPQAGAAAAHKALVKNNENTSGPIAADRRGRREGTDFIKKRSGRRLVRCSMSEKDQAGRSAPGSRRSGCPWTRSIERQRGAGHCKSLQIVADSAPAGAGVAK